LLLIRRISPTFLFDDRHTMGADSNDRRMQEEARRLVERGIDAVARTAENQIRQQQGQTLVVARRQARAAVIDFLAGASR